MSHDPPDQEDGGGDLAVQRERKIEKIRRYRIVFHNDDYTTKWFVVLVLMRFFRLTEEGATTFMLGVHEQGSGVIGVYPKDIAESKVAQVTEFAKEHGMPLRLTAEPDE